MLYGFVLGFLLLFMMIYFFTGYNHGRKNNPSIAYSTALNLNVKSISFERNGLHINDTTYIAGGVSWYSRLHYSNRVFRLNEIKPPFYISKKNNNDTLTILKDSRKYYILISEETNYSKNSI